MKMSKKVSSNIVLFLAAIIWGFAFVAQVDGMNYIGPFTLIGVRFVIAIIALLPVLFVFERKKLQQGELARTCKAVLIVGLLLFAAVTVQQFGIQITASAGVSGLISGLYTIFVPMAYFVFFRKKTGAQVWIGAVCAVIGLFLLCYDPQSGLHFGLGELLLLISSFMWTAHVMLIDHFVKTVRPLYLSWGQFAVCAVLGIICMFIFEGDQLSVQSLIDARWCLFYCGVLSSAGAYTLQVVGQKNADPTSAAIILSTESAFGAIGGALFGIDNIPLIGYVGCALIFGGILFSQTNFKKKNASAPDTKSAE